MAAAEGHPLLTLRERIRVVLDSRGPSNFREIYDALETGDRHTSPMIVELVLRRMTEDSTVEVKFELREKQ